MFDWIVRHARIADGTGAPIRLGDVAIEKDRIAAIGDLSAAAAHQTLDAHGALLCPGFIDAHTHSDTFILIEPFAPSKLAQGVTTEVCGNCGGSAAPKLNGVKLPSDWEALTYPHSWQTVAEYRAALSSAKPAVNILLYVGHNTLRKGVCGDAPRAATEEEVKLMCRRLEQALEEGAWGLSTGLVYHPGVHARPEEVQALARTAARLGGAYATHMRSEGDRLLEAVDEVLNLGRDSGIRLQISHLKTAGHKNWYKIDALLSKLNAARAEGLTLHADRYPYLAAGTDLDIVLPDWASAGGRDAILANLANPTKRQRIIDELNACERDWNAVQLGGTWSERTRTFAGRMLSEVFATEGSWQSIGELVAEIIESDGTRTSAFFFGMCETNLDRILQQDWVMAGSDASLRSPSGPLSIDYPHPRAYGTMPEFFRRVKAFSTTEEAVRRMTGLPAEAFGLHNRGLVKEGYAADLTLVDEALFSAEATYANPRQFARGVREVWVNGGHTFSNGQFLDDRRGVFLARGEA